MQQNKVVFVCAYKKRDYGRYSDTSATARGFTSRLFPRSCVRCPAVATELSLDRRQVARDGGVRGILRGKATDTRAGITKYLV